MTQNDFMSISCYVKGLLLILFSTLHFRKKRINQTAKANLISLAFLLRVTKIKCSSSFQTLIHVILYSRQTFCQKCLCAVTSLLLAIPRLHHARGNPLLIAFEITFLSINALIIDWIKWWVTSMGTVPLQNVFYRLFVNVLLINNLPQRKYRLLSSDFGAQLYEFS